MKPGLYRSFREWRRGDLNDAWARARLYWLLAPKVMRAFPFTKVAAIWVMTDSTLYALLQPWRDQRNRFVQLVKLK